MIYEIPRGRENDDAYAGEGRTWNRSCGIINLPQRPFVLKERACLSTTSFFHALRGSNKLEVVKLYRGPITV